MADEKHPDLAALLQRLQAIEERQDRLEARLRDWKRDEPPRRPAPKTAPLTPPSPPKADVKVEAAEEILTALPVEPSKAAQAVPTAESAPPPPSADDQEEAPRRPPHSLEQDIGLKWAGWIGAIVLAIGAGLGIKFAYEQGWLGHLPVEVRLLLMSLVGFVLLGAGEIVYRRVNVISAAAVFGAGVTVLFLISYAGNTYYGAYSYQTAFVFALLTTLIGSGVAIRGRLVSIAVLSQIGGQLGPIVLSTGQPPGLPLLGYVLMLQMVALILALWGRSTKWWALRALSLAGTSWWVLVAFMEGHWSQGLGNEVLWFGIVSAAFYQGELLRSALLAGCGDRPSILTQGWGTLFSLLVTAGLTTVALHVFYDYNSAALRGGSTLLLAASCLAGGFLFSGRDNRLVHALAIGYLVQGVALLLLFVPVTFSNIWIALAWAVLSLAFATIGARFDRDLARGGAIAAWVLAVGRLLIDAVQARPGNPAGQAWLVVAGHPILAYTVIAWLVALTGQAVAWLIQTRLLKGNHGHQSAPWWEPCALAASIAASLVWLSASLDGLPHLGATLAIVLYAWLLFGFDFVPQNLHLATHAVALVLLVAFKWAWVDGMLDRVSADWSATEYIPVLNPFMGTGVLLAVSLASMVRLKQATFEGMFSSYMGRGLRPGAFFFTLAILVLAILTIGLSFEADRLVERAAATGHQLVWSVEQLKHFALTILWLAIVLTLAMIGRRIGFQTLVPWVLFLMLAVKFLLVDMLLMRLTVLEGPAPVTVIFNAQVLTAVLTLVGFLILSRISPLPRQKMEHEKKPVATGDSPGRGEGGKTLDIAALSTAPSFPWFLDVQTGEEFPLFRAGTIEPVQAVRLLSNLVSLLILLLAGTLEIDRAFAGSLAASFSDPRLAQEVAISIFWSLFAIAAVLAGFRWWSTGLRLFGLSLFGVTVLKVLLIDLREVRFGYRILSLLGLGLLLLATSVLYGKVGSKRLRPRD